MALDFPAAPTLGQKYPASPIAGIPTYTWDGEKWTTVAVPIAGKTIVYSDGSTAMTAQLTLIAPPVAPTDAAAKSYVDSAAAAAAVGAVHYDAAQVLTAPQQVQARANIYAAPFDAMAYSGMQVNGSFDICQETPVGSNVGIVTSGRVGDVWTVSKAGSSVLAAGVFAYAGFPGFSNALAIQVNTAQAVMGATDYATVDHRIEGYRLARLAWGTANAQPITIGFWTAHHRPGLYTGTIRNGTATRTYAFSYTQAAADVAQYNVVTIPGDTTGTWTPFDNTVGMFVNFTSAGGASDQTPSLNAWVAGSFHSGPGQINAVAATTDVFRITGIVFLPGNEAPSAARSPLIMRPYDQKLLLVKRYYNNNLGVAWEALVTAGADYGWTSLFPVPMRTTPSLQANDNLSLNMGAPVALNVISGGSGFEYRKRASATGSGNLFSTVTADARL